MSNKKNSILSSNEGEYVYIDEIKKDLIRLRESIENINDDLRRSKNFDFYIQTVGGDFLKLNAKLDKFVKFHKSAFESKSDLIKSYRRRMSIMHRIIRYSSFFLAFIYFSELEISSHNSLSGVFFAVSVSKIQLHEFVLAIIIYINILHSMICWCLLMKSYNFDQNLVNAQKSAKRISREINKSLSDFQGKLETRMPKDDWISTMSSYSVATYSFIKESNSNNLENLFTILFTILITIFVGSIFNDLICMFNSFGWCSSFHFCNYFALVQICLLGALYTSAFLVSQKFSLSLKIRIKKKQTLYERLRIFFIF